MSNPDASREAAHRRYAKAAQTAAKAGSSTQGGLLDAYKNLLQNAEWQPDENWAQGFQDGAPASISESTRQLVPEETWQPASQPQQQQQPTQIQPAAPSWNLVTPVAETASDERPKGQDRARAARDGYSLSVAPARTKSESEPLDVTLLPEQKPVASAGDSSVPFERILRDGNILQERINPLRPAVIKGKDLQQQPQDEWRYQGSQQQLEDYQKAFADWQEDWNQRTAVDENSPLATIGLGDLQKRINEEVQRRFTDANTGELRSDNPLGWNFLGFTSQQQTPQAARNIYDWHFRNEDAATRSSGAPAWQLDEPTQSSDGPVIPAWLSSGRTQSGLALRDDDLMTLLRQPQSRKFVDDWYNAPIVDPNSIDDGSSPESREALMMTGQQYLKYREQFGLPGRDIKDIDPNELYNKQREQEQYGFIPYITSQESLDRFHDAAAPMMVSDLFNDLANLRRDNTDFTLNYNGMQISGKDFSKNVRLWNQRNAGKQGTLVYSEDEAGDGAIPQALVAYDENGQEFVAPNAPIEEVHHKDGRIQLRFNDNPNDDWWFKGDQDYNDNMGHRPAADGEWVGMWETGIEPLKLDSGQVLRADQASDLWEHQDQYADYGPLDWNKPYVEDPFKEGGWAPWIVDLALSSAPYFYLPASGAKAAGDAMNNVQGFRNGTQDYINDTYSLLSENPTREQQVTSTLGSIAMPVTERLWGPLGEKALGGSPARRIASVFLPDRVLERPISRLAIGGFDEGFEEIPGNVVEEFQANGISDWYANNMYQAPDGSLTPSPTSIGEDGKAVENPIAYDSQGRQIKAPTGFFERLSNMGADAPLAFTGGAILGGGLGLLNMPSYRREYRNAMQERNDLGYNGSPVVDMDALARTSGLDEFQRRYYNAPSSR